MLVLFDIGSTLLEGPPKGPGGRLATAFGLPPEVQNLLSDLLFQRAYTGPDHLAETLASEFLLPPARARAEVRSLWEAQIEEAYPLPGAHEALDTVTAAGHTIAFVSNIWPPFLEAFRRHFPSAYANCRGYYSFQMATSKPNPSIFRAALTASRVPPAQAVVIGDTYQNDISPGLSLGMAAIWVLHRPEKEKASITRVLNGMDPSPTLTIDSIDMLTSQHLRSLRS
jgi:HAD superfamily hydrolase (TIGR01509 family)